MNLGVGEWVRAMEWSLVDFKFIWREAKVHFQKWEKKEWKKKKDDMGHKYCTIIFLDHFDAIHTSHNQKLVSVSKHAKLVNHFNNAINGKKKLSPLKNVQKVKCEWFLNLNCITAVTKKSKIIIMEIYIRK